MGRRGILHGGRVRALAAVAALVACILAWPADGQVVCTGGGCGGGGAVTSPVTTDPVSATGVWTFNNAANTPITCSDGLIDSTLTAGRVTFSGASGRLSDDADLTFATDTLSATKVTVATTLTSPNLVAPVGSAQAVSATAPAATTGASQVGKAVTINASNAVASTDTAGAAAGGSVTITAGNAARFTSGNANGGDINLVTGAGIGTGVSGQVLISDGTNTLPGLAFVSDTDLGLYRQSANVLAFNANGTRATLSTTAFGLASGTAFSGAGTSIMYGLLSSVETVAATKTPFVSEALELYTNGTDVDGQAITLTNDPTVGVCFEFALTSTDTSNSFAIAPSAGETLQDGASACATSFSATAKGATARICAVSGGSGALWLVMSKNGTWTCS